MVVFPQSWERGKQAAVLSTPCLCYHGVTPAPNTESGLIFGCDESIPWDYFSSDLIWLTQCKWGDLGSERWSVFLTSKLLRLPCFFPPHFMHRFALIHLSFLIFCCAAFSLFSASFALSLPASVSPPFLPSALFTLWKMPKFPATTYYKMLSSRTWISVWRWQPSASWERGMRLGVGGEREKSRGRVLCLCALVQRPGVRF